MFLKVYRRIAVLLMIKNPGRNFGSSFPQEMKVRHRSWLVANLPFLKSPSNPTFTKNVPLRVGKAPAIAPLKFQCILHIKESILS